MLVVFFSYHSSVSLVSLSSASFSDLVGSAELVESAEPVESFESLESAEYGGTVSSFFNASASRMKGRNASGESFLVAR